VLEKDMIQLLDHSFFPDGHIGQRDQLILELFYGTGIRLSELISIKDIDISHSDHTIKVLGKRNKERIIPINSQLLNQIKAYIEIRNTQFGTESRDSLLVTDSGKPCYPMLIQRAVKKYLSMFNTIEKKSPHALRHTYATHLLNRGADLNAVKELLGHSSLAATQVYTHNSMDKLKSIFKKAHPKA
jgi:integrase/recombinase XerC